MQKINTIILDWAGTSVDFGCFAPVNAFISAFEKFGISASIEETRAPMGMAKRAHVEKMLQTGDVAKQWAEIHKRPFTQEDVDKIYSYFEPALFETLTDYTNPITGVIEAVARIREMGIKIGSTTGYTKAMMEVVVPSAKEKGYSPDFWVAPEDVAGLGRPYPFMVWRNLEALSAPSINNVLKVGDTIADIEEAVNAGCISVGVLKGSSLLGLSEQEIIDMDNADLSKLLADARQKYRDAGANYIIDTIGDLPDLIESINREF